MGEGLARHVGDVSERVGGGAGRYVREMAERADGEGFAR